MSDYVEAGCTKCGQKFNLPVTADDTPIWTHVCPKTTDERIEELTGLVRGLGETVEQSKETVYQLMDTNYQLARQLKRTTEDISAMPRPMREAIIKPKEQ